MLRLFLSTRINFSRSIGRGGFLRSPVATQALVGRRRELVGVFIVRNSSIVISNNLHTLLLLIIYYFRHAIFHACRRILRISTRKTKRRRWIDGRCERRRRGRPSGERTEVGDVRPLSSSAPHFNNLSGVHSSRPVQGVGCGDRIAVDPCLCVCMNGMWMCCVPIQSGTINFHSATA